MFQFLSSFSALKHNQSSNPIIIVSHITLKSVSFFLASLSLHCFMPLLDIPSLFISKQSLLSGHSSNPISVIVQHSNTQIYLKILNILQCLPIACTKQARFLSMSQKSFSEVLSVLTSWQSFLSITCFDYIKLFEVSFLF